jgi:hypothetical protein
VLALFRLAQGVLRLLPLGESVATTASVSWSIRAAATRSVRSLSGGNLTGSRDLAEGQQVRAS